jgi:cellobiose phosphorylase
MNRVGIQGTGESVWLGFFLYEVLRQFEALARRHDDTGFAEFRAADGLRLSENLEQHAWDGAWYRRAWRDLGGYGIRGLGRPSARPGTHHYGR